MLLLILITILSVCAFFGLWFHITFRQLSKLKDGISYARRQIELHSNSLSGAATVLYQSHSQFALSKKLYNEAVRHYNTALHKPYYFITGSLMGFTNEKLIKENT